MQFKIMRYLILFMALMTNTFMFAQSEVCPLDSQYLALVQQKKYGEAEALLRDNKEAFISLYGDFDFAYGITFARMLKYSNEKENILLDGISDEIKIVLSKYITDNSSISHYFADWGNYLYFCTLCGSKSDTIIDLCSKANDIYVTDCTKDNFEKYLYISKNIWEHYYNQAQWDKTYEITDKVIAKASMYSNYSTIAECFYLNGAIEKVNNNLEDAVSFWEKSIDNFNKCDNAKEFVDYANALYECVLYYQNKGNYSKSFGYSKYLPTICKGIYGYNSIEHVNALSHLFVDQYHLQRVDEAIKTIQTAKDICDSTSSINLTLKNDVMTSYKMLSNLISPKLNTSPLNQNQELNDSIIGERRVVAITCMRQGEYDKALEIFESLFSYYSTNGVTTQNCQSFLGVVSQLAGCFSEIGKYEMADKCLHEGLRIIKKKQIHTHDVRLLYAALGTNYYNMQNYMDALTNMSKAKQLYEIANDKYGADYAMLLANMAVIFVEEGSVLKALLYNEEAASIFRKSMITNIKEYSYVVNNLAVIYSKTNNIDKAIGLLKELVRTTKENHLYQEYGLALGNLGERYLRFEDYASAISCFKEALPFMKNENMRNDICQELIGALGFSNSSEYEYQISNFNDEMRAKIKKIIGAFSEREWNGYWEKNQIRLLI